MQDQRSFAAASFVAIPSPTMMWNSHVSGSVLAARGEVGGNTLAAMDLRRRSKQVARVAAVLSPRASNSVGMSRLPTFVISSTTFC